MDATLIGQQLGNTPLSCIENYPHFIEDLFAVSERHPAILGVGYWGSADDDYARLHDLLREHAENNGIYTAYLRLNNPWTGESHHDTTRGRLIELITPGTYVYNVWMHNLDFLVEKLLQIQDLPGIFRPFHECTHINNAWWNCVNWYSNPELREQETDDFKLVWQHWHNYFDKAGLTNLKWVLSTANRTEPAASIMYAGDNYVDLCGPSLYGENLVTDYNSPAQLVICEEGNDSGVPISMLNYLPQLILQQPGYMLNWSSWQSTTAGHYVAIVDNHDAVAFMHHPQIICREDLPITEPINLQIATKFDELAALFRQL